MERAYGVAQVWKLQITSESPEKKEKRLELLESPTSDAIEGVLAMRKGLLRGVGLMGT